MKAHEFLIEAEATKSYKIKPGDTLSRIAKDNSTTVNAIMDLNRDNRAVRDRDTIYAGGTIKIPTTSTGFDSDARVKRQGATSADKSDTVAKIGNQEFPLTKVPDDVAKIGNQEFPLTKGPDAPGANDDMGGKNFGIDDTEWEFPTVELGFGDPGYAPLTGKTHVEKRPDGKWYYTSNGVMAKPDVARFAEKRLNGLYVVKSKDIGSQKFPMTKGPTPNTGSTPNLPPRVSTKDKNTSSRPTRPGQEEDDLSPIPGVDIGSPFGRRPPPKLPRGKGFGSDNHQGVDFKVRVGTPVYAPNNAVVLRAGEGFKAGRYIELGDRYGNLTHKFFHLSEILVSPGDTVTRGQEIAKSGDTGFTTGPHLHWEKWVDGQPVDPAPTMKSWSKT